MFPLILSLILATPRGGMVLAAHTDPATVAVSVTVSRNLVDAGASEDSVRTQAEAAMRRCGFGIGPRSDAPLHLYVAAAGVKQGARGFAGALTVQFLVSKVVDGELVLIDASTDFTAFAGPPGMAGSQIREYVAEYLDGVCNKYLEARQATSRR